MEEEGNIDLNFVEKQFLCCTPINRFDWNDSESITHSVLDTISPEMQKRILEKTVNNDLVKKYPIKRSYQRAFLKLLINQLEKNSQEIDDDLYNIYCSLVSSDDQETSTQYRHFLYDHGGSKDAITLQESVNIVSLGTTGLCTWQAGLGLAEWCMTNKELFKDKKVLELGCGVGLTGLAVIRACEPKEYVFSDYHFSVLDMLSKNIVINLKPEEQNSPNHLHFEQADVKLEINHNGIKVEAVRLLWEEVSDSLNETDRLAYDPDIVLAADVLYDDSCFDSLAGALRYLLRRQTSYAILAATIRNTQTIEEFIKKLGSYDLVFKDLENPERRYFVHTDDTPIRMMKIRRETHVA